MNDEEDFLARVVHVTFVHPEASQGAPGKRGMRMENLPERRPVARRGSRRTGSRQPFHTTLCGISRPSFEQKSER
jgi:hypothetical protein